MGRSSESQAVTQVEVNRAPVLTLWASVVAEQLGFDPDEALTMGRVVAGLNAYSKGISLGIFKPAPEELRRKRLRAGTQMHVDLLHRAVPVVQTPRGLRAVSKEKPIDPSSVRRYLESKFGDALPAIKEAMRDLAKSLAPEELSVCAYKLYEGFRPDVPPGSKGWGAKGRLDVSRIRAAEP